MASPAPELWDAALLADITVDLLANSGQAMQPAYPYSTLELRSEQLPAQRKAKRQRITYTAKLRELQEQLEEATATYTQLSINNVLLAERARILEKVRESPRPW
jgi:hypothetical protein